MIDTDRLKTFVDLADRLATELAAVLTLMPTDDPLITDATALLAEYRAFTTEVPDEA